MTTDSFRSCHRAYGLLIPAHEISAHLACGWRPVDQEEVYERQDAIFMRPGVTNSCFVVAGNPEGRK